MFALQIAEVAALVGDPARCNMLCALMDGRSLPASELASAAGISPQTASSHLAKLTEANLLDLVPQGRHRYYRIKSATVAQMLEHLLLVAVDGPPRYRPRSKIDDALRAARTCYDHFAGHLGVGLTDALALQGYLVLNDEGVGELTESGAGFLCDFGIDVGGLRRGRRALCRTCIDWSERRPHLGGSLGAALAARCFELGWVNRHAGTRAVIITEAGHRGFAERFGWSLNASRDSDYALARSTGSV
jgi:DNA-binding transcriptional ArsR family regulator